MFIDKEKWNELIESFNKIYSNYDYFSDNMKDLIDKVDICIDDIKRNNTISCNYSSNVLTLTIGAFSITDKGSSK